MPLELNITPEDVDALVRDTLMRSAFGKTITEAVNKALSTDHWDSPINKALKRHVADVASELLRDKYAAQVRAAIAAAIEAKVTPNLIDETVSHAIEKMVRAAEDRY